MKKENEAWEVYQQMLRAKRSETKKRRTGVLDGDLREAFLAGFRAQLAPVLSHHESELAVAHRRLKKLRAGLTKLAKLLYVDPADAEDLLNADDDLRRGR